MIRNIAAGLATALLTTSAFAHGDHDPDAGKGNKPPPLAVLQLDEVRNATARYLDVDVAVAHGYVDIGLFVPNMGWHYMKETLVDERFDPDQAGAAGLRRRSLRRQAQAGRGGIRGAAVTVEERALRFRRQGR